MWLGKCKVLVLDLPGRAPWAFGLRLMGIQSFLTDFIHRLLGVSTFLGPRGLSEPVSRSSLVFGTYRGFFSWFVPEGAAPPLAWQGQSGAP